MVRRDQHVRAEDLRLKRGFTLSLDVSGEEQRAGPPEHEGGVVLSAVERAGRVQGDVRAHHDRDAAVGRRTDERGAAAQIGDHSAPTSKPSRTAGSPAPVWSG